MDKLFNGATLGTFRIIHQIGEGGMAKVYKAYQPSMERYVALKVLPSHYAEDPQFVERFIREARTIAALEHRNILPVIDFGEENGITYLAMRYVEGGTLKELLNKGRLTMHDVLDLLAQIASALDYAHRRGVIHRDVKPSNVILDGEGAAYLMDFGIAKVIGKSGDLTATGAAIGTPAYMAPEQALGEGVDSRTDIYALGILLYEMVVGRVPYQADTPMAVLMAHLRDPLPLPREMDPAVPEPVEAVIIKALAKKPDDRYQTANELADAFRKALQVSYHAVEASTLVTLINEVKTSRPEQPAAAAVPLTPSRQRSAVSIDPRLKERMDQDYIDGLSAFWIRDWEKARVCFEAVLAVNPDYKDTASRLQEVEKQVRLAELYSQAQAAMDGKDWKSAQEKLRQLVALDKAYQKSDAMLKTVELRLEMQELYAQADQLFQAGQWQAVVNIFDRMRGLEPNVPDTKNLLSQAKAALLEQQRQEKVKALYQHGLEALEAGKWKEALKLFDQVKAQQPGFGNVDLLIKRVQDEINRTRIRPTLKPAPTRLSATRPAPVTLQAPPESHATQKVEAASAEADQAPSMPAVPVKRKYFALLIIGMVVLLFVVVLGAALFVPGAVDKVAGLIGLQTPTSTPEPGPPPTSPPVPNLYDDFKSASVTGMLDQNRWKLEGDCGAFSNYNRLVQDEKLRLYNRPKPDPLSCKIFTQAGQRLPAADLGAIEAKLNVVNQSKGGFSLHTLSMLTGDETKSFQVVCGLRSWEDGSLVQFFSAWENVNGKITELAHKEAKADFDTWYTARLQLNPANLSFECRLDGRPFGSYQPPNGDLLRQAEFARLLEDERGPQSEARTLFDDVRLIPLAGASVEQPAASTICPAEIKGWKAEFWNNSGMYGEPIICTEIEKLDVDWKTYSPVPGKIPVDHFAARFTRQIDLDGGVYRFRLGGDDGIRMWVDDRLIIDQWHSQPYTIYSADIDLPAGGHLLRVLYFDNEDVARLRLNYEKDPNRAWAAAQGCLQPPADLLDWWAGDGDGSNDRPGPELSLDQGVKFAPGLVAEGFLFETLSRGSPVFARWKEADPRLTNLQRITIETWVKLGVTGIEEQDQARIRLQEKALTSVERFVTLGNTAVLRKEFDGTLHFFMEINGELRHTRSESTLPRGEFFHVAGTYDGRWMILYWNGEKVGALDFAGNMAPVGDLYLSSETESLFGVLDEVSMYGSALSPDQIKAIYTAGPYGKCK